MNRSKQRKRDFKKQSVTKERARVGEEVGLIVFGGFRWPSSFTCHQGLAKLSSLTMHRCNSDAAIGRGVLLMGAGRSGKTEPTQSAGAMKMRPRDVI